MITCTSCGNDVTGKKFCSQCGTAVQTLASLCPACHTEVPAGHAFCSNCGYNVRAATTSPREAAPLFCTNCGRKNDAGVRFCAECGTQLNAVASEHPTFTPPPPSNQYPQSQYGSSSQYPQYQQPYSSGGYQSQPMVGQQPMALRCPTCMAMWPVGTPNCQSCRTSLAGIVPTPANVVAGQQNGMGGFLQGNGGKYAMGALGGAAAVIGGEMLLHGIEDSIEGRVEGDMGYGYGRRHHHREEGLLGGLGELADDIGL